MLCFFSLTPLFSQSAVSLEQAIRSSASEIGSRLAANTTIAVVNFSSASPSMSSDYVIGELNKALINETNLVVVGRGEVLKAAQDEQIFGLSGEVSDDSAQRIGRLVGAKMVVSGSLSIAGAVYRLRVQVLEVETGVLRYVGSQNVPMDNFTPGERAGAAALNLALGAGSFIIQKDAMGGAITAVLEAIGVAAVVVSPFLVKETQKTDIWTGLWYTERDTSISTPFFYGGIAAFAGGAIYGVYRALSYQKPDANVAVAPPLPWSIALIPVNSGNAAVRLSYTFRF